MPNIQEWVEAQLKRGYSASHIKAFLIKKGYPPEAAAEVDKIAYTVPPAKTSAGKKIPSKPIALVSIVMGIILLVWLINALPFFSKQVSEDIAAEQKSDEQIAEEENLEIKERELRRLQEREAIQPNEPIDLGVETYSGIITQYSPTSITLEVNGSTKDFQFSDKIPEVYIIGYGSDRGNHVETAQIGDKVSVWVIVSEEGLYISRVVIRES